MTRKQHLIALTGFAGTGKDTVADLLAAHLGFEKHAFADPLRNEVAQGFCIEPIYLAHPSTKNLPIAALAMRNAPRDFLAAVALELGAEHRSPDGRIAHEWLDAPRSPRQILQWWGTEYRRGQAPNYWTRIMTERVTQLRRLQHDRLVITDLRFANEAETVRSLSGQVWRISRPGIDAATTPEGAHASATDGAAFAPDVVINNRHDIAHLQRLVFDEFMAAETGLRDGAAAATAAAMEAQA